MRARLRPFHSSRAISFCLIRASTTPRTTAACALKPGLAKEIFLSTERALETAREQNVFLKELKSGARGVIGALAGIGLRLSGNDGKIRGKFELKKSNLNVAELLGLNFIEAVADENLKPLSPNERVNLIGALKPVFLDFKATLLVKKEADGGFRNLSVKELRGF